MNSLALEIASRSDLDTRMMVAAADNCAAEFHYSIKITVYDEANKLVDDYLYLVEIDVGHGASSKYIEVKDENGHTVVKMYVDNYHMEDAAWVHSLLNNIPRLLFDYHDYIVFEERHEDE